MKPNLLLLAVTGRRSAFCRIAAFCVSILAVLSTSACGGLGLDRLGRAEEIAGQARMEPVSFDTGPFVLKGFMRRSADPARNHQLMVYIEGDGLAWLSKYQLSRDPTPRSPTSLELAAADPSPQVLYLARPCQYTADSGAWRSCDARYWSTHRFAPEVITALGNALDQAKQRSGARRLVLVGFSGGGVAAALLAERRTDVDALATVASPLDLAAWTAFHKVTPLYGSLAPTDQADKLAKLPQVHFVGADDRVVPGTIVESFLGRLGPGADAHMERIPATDHGCCWAEHWPVLRGHLPAVAAVPDRAGGTGTVPPTASTALATRPEVTGSGQP